MGDKNTVSLPELPKGNEFEELVSAILQSAGLYVERNIIERDTEEVLELDIITTDYIVEKEPQLTLVEVKSGHWGFSDVFKILGWKTYLNFAKARLIVQNPGKNIDFYRPKAKETGVEISVVPPDVKELSGKGKDAALPHVDPLDVEHWRFSYWIERVLLRALKRDRKEHDDKKCYRVLEDYYLLINSGIFFTRGIIRRVDSLYRSFQSCPRISARTGHEIVEGADFDFEHEAVPETLFGETFYKVKPTCINITTFIEHRARLAILKSAVDYSLYKSVGDHEQAGDRSKIFGAEFSLLDLLPNSFRDALEEISKEPWFHRYPIFWQWFLWFFGGFILMDYEQHEYQLMSLKSGIPVEHIPNAFRAYESLFPNEGGWFSAPTALTRVKVLKMFSTPFMGIGANYRRCIYTENGGYEKLELTGTYTRNDLIRWNNLGVQYLTDLAAK